VAAFASSFLAATGPNRRRFVPFCSSPATVSPSGCSSSCPTAGDGTSLSSLSAVPSLTAATSCASSCSDAFRFRTPFWRFVIVPCGVSSSLKGPFVADGGPVGETGGELEEPDHEAVWALGTAVDWLPEKFKGMMGGPGIVSLVIIFALGGGGVLSVMLKISSSSSSICSSSSISLSVSDCAMVLLATVVLSRVYIPAKDCMPSLEPAT